MRTAQKGDRVQVHYVMRCQDGSQRSSHGRSPLDLTVGTPHPRLPGLGLALVGMTPGTSKTITVPPEQGYGMPNPARVRRCSRKRFPEQEVLPIGKLVRATGTGGRQRLVRILQVDGEMVLVDTNHRWAGQTLELEVELVTIESEGEPLPTPSRAIAFDLDAANLASLKEALPGWEIETIDGSTPANLARDWGPGAAGLLVVAIRADAADTWGLCRFLASRPSSLADGARRNVDKAGLADPLQSPRRSPAAPLLVLVPEGQEALIEAALEAGAHSCLVLPLRPKSVAIVLTHARAGNQPGRHTLNTETAQRKDRWRDDGGEG
jgi:FKBP-type peptidyl-prolyl cis-trans isomerase 2